MPDDRCRPETLAAGAASAVPADDRPGVRHVLDSGQSAYVRTAHGQSPETRNIGERTSAPRFPVHPVMRRGAFHGERADRRPAVWCRATKAAAGGGNQVVGRRCSPERDDPAARTGVRGLESRSGLEDEISRARRRRGWRRGWRRCGRRRRGWCRCRADRTVAAERWLPFDRRRQGDGVTTVRALPPAAHAAVRTLFGDAIDEVDNQVVVVVHPDLEAGVAGRPGLDHHVGLAVGTDVLAAENDVQDTIRRNGEDPAFARSPRRRRRLVVVLRAKPRRPEVVGVGRERSFAQSGSLDRLDDAVVTDTEDVGANDLDRAARIRDRYDPAELVPRPARPHSLEPAGSPLGCPHPLLRGRVRDAAARARRWRWCRRGSACGTTADALHAGVVDEARI